MQWPRPVPRESWLQTVLAALTKRKIKALCAWALPRGCRTRGSQPESRRQLGLVASEDSSPQKARVLFSVGVAKATVAEQHPADLCGLLKRNSAGVDGFLGEFDPSYWNIRE